MHTHSRQHVLDLRVILLWLAAAFVVGSFVGSQLYVWPLVVLWVAAALTVALRWAWQRPRLRLTVLLLIPLLLGMARAGTARFVPGQHDLAYYNGRVLEVTGTVVAEPDVRDTGANYVIAVEHLIRGSRRLPLTGLLEVHTSAGQVLGEGDVVQLSGHIQVPISSRNVPYRDILAHRGIYSEADFPRLFVTGHRSLGLIGAAENLRLWIQGRIAGAVPEPEATMLIAILVGARSAQLGSLASVLIATGLIHLIAVSGLKIAIVAGTVHDAFKRTSSRLITLIAASTCVLSYWLISGATVAGLRASIMWLLVFLAAYLGRPSFAPVSLGIAAAVMVGFEPNILWDTGFQLTFCGTAAIVLFSPYAARFTGKLPAAFGASLTTTLAAQVGVLPIQMASFHVLSPVSIIANAIALPLIPLTMAAASLTALAPIPVFSAIAYGLAHSIILIARWASTVPAASFSVASLPIIATLAYYGLLIAIALLVWRTAASQQVRSSRGGEVVFGMTAACLGLAMAFSQPASGHAIRFLVDDSALIMSHGQNVLIDGGSRPSVLLARLGQTLPLNDRRLDVVIDTDPRSKNVASLLDVVEHVPTARVFDPGIEYPSQTYARWRAWLARHHIAVSALRPGLTVRGSGFSLRVLAPDGIYSDPRDGAGILTITGQKRTYLYLGPASQEEQQDLPFRIHATAQVAVTSAPVNPVLRRATGIHWVSPPRHGRTLPLF